jgi:hypothetical protein
MTLISFISFISYDALMHGGRLTSRSIAQTVTQRNEMSPDEGTQPHAVNGVRYEINELNEKSPAGASHARLTRQAEIEAAASAAQHAFDRLHFDALWERWHTLHDEETTNP